MVTYYTPHMMTCFWNNSHWDSYGMDDSPVELKFRSYMSLIDCIEYSRLFDDGVHPQRWAEAAELKMMLRILNRLVYWPTGSLHERSLWNQLHRTKVDFKQVESRKNMNHQMCPFCKKQCENIPSRQT